MSAIDLPYLRRWVGREQRDRDLAALRHARLMAATVDRPGPPLAAGDALPPLWHWIYFLDARPPGELGPDGHPARGGFLPPVPLPNRMWAGGAVDFAAPIPIGAAIEKRSTVAEVEHKRGRSGDLVFVRVVHEVFVDGSRALRERHDIVYKQASPPAATPPAASAADHDRERDDTDAETKVDQRPLPLSSRVWTLDATQLFRYSALTFNGHRIHYDADYCRQVEGYDGLVVHGPLIATQVALLAADALAADGRALRRFDYRARNPVTLGGEGRVALRLDARRDGAGLRLEALRPDGVVAMQADANA